MIVYLDVKTIFNLIYTSMMVLISLMVSSHLVHSGRKGEEKKEKDKKTFYDYVIITKTGPL